MTSAQLIKQAKAADHRLGGAIDRIRASLKRLYQCEYMRDYYYGIRRTRRRPKNMAGGIRLYCPGR